MKKLILIALVYLSTESNAQRINGPKWDINNIYFESKKIKQYNEKTKIYSSEKFKTAYISISDANGFSPSFEVDIPDIYYSKDFTIYQIAYKGKSESDLEYISYTLLSEDEDDMIGLTIYFREYEPKPLQILVSVTENVKDKLKRKSASYILTEFKE